MIDIIAVAVFMLGMFLLVRDVVQLFKDALK